MRILQQSQAEAPIAPQPVLTDDQSFLALVAWTKANYPPTPESRDLVDRCQSQEGKRIRKAFQGSQEPYANVQKRIKYAESQCHAQVFEKLYNSDTIQTLRTCRSIWGDPHEFYQTPLSTREKCAESLLKNPPGDLEFHIQKQKVTDVKQFAKDQEWLEIAYWVYRGKNKAVLPFQRSFDEKMKELLGKHKIEIHLDPGSKLNIRGRYYRGIYNSRSKRIFIFARPIRRDNLVLISDTPIVTFQHEKSHMLMHHLYGRPLPNWGVASRAWVEGFAEFASALTSPPDEVLYKFETIRSRGWDQNKELSAKRGLRKTLRDKNQVAGVLYYFVLGIDGNRSEAEALKIFERILVTQERAKERRRCGTQINFEQFLEDYVYFFPEDKGNLQSVLSAFGLRIDPW